MLRRKLKLPILALVLVLGAYLVLKGVMYLRVKSTMDKWVEASAGQAEIQYGAIETELRGAARVRDIEVRPREFDQSIKIAAIRLSSNDPWMLISGDDWQSGDAPPPEHMALSIEGASITLDEAMLAALRQQAEERARISGQAFTGNACDGSMNLDPDLLVDMGFTEVSMDIDADYHFDVINQRLIAEFALEVKDIESIEMSVELDGISPEDVGAAAVASLALHSAAIQVEINPAFGNRALKTCADRKQLSVAEFRQQIIKRVADDLAASGLQIGTSLRTAIATYYQDWGELRVNVRPEKPLGMMALLMTKPDRIGSLLGVNLFINDKRVDNPEFSFVAPALALQNRERDDAVLTTLPVPRRVKVTRHYEKIPTRLLDRHLGANVKIQPIGQPARMGKLTAIAGGQATVVQRTHGGSVSTYVRLDQIESLEVQRVERTALD